MECSIWCHSAPCSNRTLFKFFVGGSICIFLVIQSTGGYRAKVGVLPEVDEFIHAVKAMSLLTIALIVLQFFFDILPGSRMVAFYFWFFGILSLTLSRWMILKLESIYYSKGIGGHRALIIGSTQLSQDISERMILYPLLGYYYVGTLDDAPPEKVHFHLRDRFKLLGTAEDYQVVAKESNVSAIFLVKRDISHSLYQQISQYCLDEQIELNVLTDPILNTPFNQFRNFDGIPVIASMDLNQFSFQRIFKRIFDILGAIIGLLVFSPVIILSMIWIRLVSPNGPIFFKQKRVGFMDQPFHMIKFRSMIPDAEKGTGPVMVNESGDSRYIKGGQFLRQYSIDELPQLWNVLVGDMSLVGPRPERPHFVDQFQQYLPLFRQRHIVPVGITGWAQINGRSVLTRRPEQKIKYDFYYIKNWSFLFDIKIILKTIFVVFRKEESY